MFGITNGNYSENEEEGKTGNRIKRFLLSKYSPSAWELNSFIYYAHNLWQFNGGNVDTSIAHLS